MNALLPSLKLTRTNTARAPRAKQTILVFAPKDQKCLVHPKIVTGLEKDHSQEKKLLYISFSLSLFKVE